MLPRPSAGQSITTTTSTGLPTVVASTLIATATTAPIPSLSISTEPAVGTSLSAASSTTPAPDPAAPTGLKRPAASDLQRTAGPSSATPTPKRQATGALSVRSAVPSPSPFLSQSRASPASSAAPHTQSFLQPSPTMMPAPVVITEEQLHGRTPEQLIATILQLQNQHQQCVAQINAQYESINQQLNELRGSLVASHQAAATALSSSGQPARSIIPPPPAPIQQTAIPPPPRPPNQTPTRVTPRLPPASPGQPGGPRPSISASTPTAAGAAPTFEYKTFNTVDEVWREYKYGIAGQPAVEALDREFGSRWRPEPRGRTWYSRRKVIWDKIKEHMKEGLTEEQAVREVENLRDGGTINKLIRMLQERRKDDDPEDEVLT
ncbi:transcriptional activator of glycolytic enzymes-domain-containing protein [Xylariaceae sp. FL1272]|nr:transcriptional activator of glycolytic enzymes-domain-containing protein [Xylariaceae sp. FL1272]